MKAESNSALCISKAKTELFLKWEAVVVKDEKRFEEEAGEMNRLLPAEMLERIFRQG